MQLDHLGPSSSSTVELRQTAFATSGFKRASCLGSRSISSGGANPTQCPTSPPAPMVDVVPAVDTLLATRWRKPAVTRQEQRGRKRSRNADATEPEKTAAVSLRGVSCAEDMSRVEPSKLLTRLESAKDPQPKAPQHIPGNSDDIGAVQVTAQSAAAGGSSVPNSSTEHNEISDITLFPIACTLEKHARGFYILSGVCGLCNKTFRATGGIYRGRVQPWNSHARVEYNIVQHARMHGVFGYTTRRNLDEMRLDWVRLPDRSSRKKANAWRSRKRVATRFVATQSTAAGSPNTQNYSVGKSETKHSETSDVNTFPISCFLYKDARDVYTVSGFCCLCDQTFRAAGSVVRGKVQPWRHHAKIQHNIVQHARMHGVVGYTPRRNLDTMRLDWVRSPGEASDVMADASASRYRKTTTFCTGCARWRRKNHFRHGASTCRTCLRITCAACGKSQRGTQYISHDVWRSLNTRANVRCQTCRREGKTMKGAKHKTHKGGYCRERRCTKCGVYRAVSAFRWTKKRGRVDICISCELVPCETCAAMLSRGNFAGRDIRGYFNSAGAKHITCLVCKEQRQHARQKRLQELMKKSKRRFCTCKHPQAHTRTCLLRIKFA